jgi:hypothetical protein
MPKEKDCTKLIPRIYKKHAENIGLFFFVNAQRQIVPTVTLEQAIWNYFRYAEIDDWDMESAMTTYSRLQVEFFKDCESETSEKDC